MLHCLSNKIPLPTAFKQFYYGYIMNFIVYKGECSCWWACSYPCILWYMRPIKLHSATCSAFFWNLPPGMLSRAAWAAQRRRWRTCCPPTLARTWAASAPGLTKSSSGTPGHRRSTASTPRRPLHLQLWEGLQGWGWCQGPVRRQRHQQIHLAAPDI